MDIPISLVLFDTLVEAFCEGLIKPFGLLTRLEVASSCEVVLKFSMAQTASKNSATNFLSLSVSTYAGGPYAYMQ